MALLERTVNPVEHENPGAGPGDGGNNTAELRQAGEDFLGAADDAIARALSTDSTTFLNATQQEGGE